MSGKIFFVVLRHDGFVDAVAVSGEQLFFEAADGQDFAAKCDFAGHGDIAPDGDVRERAADGGRHGDAGGGAVLRDRAFGDVEVDIEIAVEIARAGRVGASGSGRSSWRLGRIPASLRRALPVTVSLPLPSIRVASVVRIWPPTSVQARPVAAPTAFFLLASRSRYFNGPKQFNQLFRVDDDRAGFLVVAIDVLPSDSCGRHYRFRVRGCEHRLPGYSTAPSPLMPSSVNSISFGDRPVCSICFTNQKSPGDFLFFEFRVAGEADHFHAVLKSGRNGVEIRSRSR